MRRLFALLVTMALIAAACGDDGSGSTSKATDGPTVTDAPSTTQPPAETTTTAAETTTTTAAGTTTTVAPIAASDDTIFFVGSDAEVANFNIFSVKTDGTERTQLTDMTDAFIPNISPDRTRVAFFNTDAGEEFVWTMDADGGNLTQVTDYSSATADWHPDGTSLIMNSDSQGEPADTPDVYSVALDGTVIEQLIDSDATADFDAHFTPDGSTVVFVSTRNGDADLFLLDIASGEVVEFIGGPGDQAVPRISPDGTMVLFTNTADGNSDVYLTDFEDGPVTVLTDGPEVDDMADWSPDGQRIVFMSDRSGNFDLWMMDADGSNPIQLTDTPELELFPSWS